MGGDNCEAQLRSCWVGAKGTLKVVNRVQRGEKKTDGSFLATLHLGQFPRLSFYHPARNFFAQITHSQRAHFQWNAGVAGPGKV